MNVDSFFRNLQLRKSSFSSFSTPVISYDFCQVLSIPDILGNMIWFDGNVLFFIFYRYKENFVPLIFDLYNNVNGVTERLTFCSNLFISLSGG